MESKTAGAGVDEKDFRSSYLVNRAAADTYRFYSIWDDLEQDASALVAMLHADDFCLDLTFGVFENETEITGFWKKVQSLLSRASHHLTAVDATVEADGKTVEVHVEMTAQLDHVEGGIQVLRLRSSLRWVREEDGELKLLHYRVREI